MNFKQNLLAAALAGSLLVGGAAHADHPSEGWYAGLEGQYNHYGLGSDFKNAATTPSGNLTTAADFSKSAAGLGFFGGHKFSQNWAAEFGFNFSGKVKSKDMVVSGAGTTLEVKTHTFYADALGFLPVANDFNLVGSLGLGLAKSKSSVADGSIATLTAAQRDSLEKSKTSLALRVGAGVEYNFDENISGRAMVRYQHAGSSSPIKNQTQFGLGVAYHF